MKELEKRDPRALELANKYLAVNSKDFLDDPWPFVSAGEWADNVKGTGWKSLNPIHFLNIPVFGKDYTDKPRNKHVNATTAYYACVDTIKHKDTKYTGIGKGLAIRMVIHLVGDIHQPLHTSTLFDSDFPKGDVGGNAFEIFYEKKKSLKNLHSFWDDFAHQYGNIEVPLSELRQKRLISLVEDLLERYPRSELIRKP